MASPMRPPIVFRTPWWLSILCVLGTLACLALSAGSIWFIVTDPNEMPPILMLIFGLAALLMLVPAAACLDVLSGSTRLDGRGVTIRRRGRTRVIPLSEVLLFGVQESGTNESGQFEVIIRQRIGFRPVKFGGYDLRVKSWTSRRPTETAEQLNDWLEHERAR